MEDIKLIRTAETDSTNRLLREYAGEEGRLMTVLTADYQTAGRGQGGNTWESAPGENLLVSVRLHPQALSASRQYALTEAGALAVRDTAARYAGEASVKWPNDVYVGDRKVSGTLSECDISGTLIKTCTLGIGLNVNQQEFTGDAPNPVSLAQLAGRRIDREARRWSTRGCTTACTASTSARCTAAGASSCTRMPGAASAPRPRRWSTAGGSCCGAMTGGCHAMSSRK